jgi:RNA polymerase sigma-70 factor (ECF subfamily)
VSAVRDRHADESDATLVLAIARSDQAALAATYRRHAGAVYGFARRVLREQALAEEIVQEIFLRLWRDPMRFDPARGSLRTYLLTETHNRAVDMLRAELARRAREDRHGRRAAEAGRDVVHEVVGRAASAGVRRSIAGLPAEERAAIELAFFGGHTYREVALRLDQPEGTVKSRIRSGLKRLRVELVAAGITSDGF